MERAITKLEQVQNLLTIEERKKYQNIRKIESILKRDSNLFEYRLIWEDEPSVKDLKEAAEEYIHLKRDEDLIYLDNISSELSKLIKISEQFNEIVSDPEKRENLDIKEIVVFKNLIDKYSLFENEFSNLENQKKNIDKINKNIIANNNTAQKIIDDLKSRFDFLNQKIDENSNNEIQTMCMKIHDDEIILADKYRNWALYIFCGVGLILLICFLNISIQNWNHLRDSTYIEIPFGKDSLLRILMLFSLTTPAWYLTREASKHRKVAYKARMIGTELACFPLYARELKDEDRLELRKNLADRFFGQELYTELNQKINSDNSIEQVKLLTEANKVLAESLKIKKVMD